MTVHRLHRVTQAGKLINEVQNDHRKNVSAEGTKGKRLAMQLRSKRFGYLTQLPNTICFYNVFRKNIP